MNKFNLSQLLIVTLVSMFNIVAISMDDIESLKAENNLLKEKLYYAEYRLFMVSLQIFSTYDEFIENKFNDGNQPFCSFITQENCQEMVEKILNNAKIILINKNNNLNDLGSRIKKYVREVLGMDLDDFINSFIIENHN